MSGIVVVAAAIIRDGRLLLTQRSIERDFPLHWECPGGKVEEGENPREALARELEEELLLMPEELIIQPEPFFTTVFEPPDMPRRVALSFYAATEAVEIDPHLIDVVGLGWFGIAEMAGLRLIPGNLRLLAKLEADGLPILYSSKTRR
jgi:8-oxo-dGTP diphosphatase